MLQSDDDLQQDLLIKRKRNREDKTKTSKLFNNEYYRLLAQ